MKQPNKKILSTILFFTSAVAFAQNDCVMPGNQVVLANYLAEQEASAWIDMGVSFEDAEGTRASAFDIKAGAGGVDVIRFRSTKGPNERTLLSIEDMIAKKPTVLLNREGRDVITLIPAVVDNKCLGPKGCQAFLKYLHTGAPEITKTRVVTIRKVGEKWELSITGADTQGGTVGALVRNVKKVIIHANEVAGKVIGIKTLEVR